MQRPRTCLFVNIKLCLKLIASILIMFDDNRKVTQIKFFAADFNLSRFNLSLICKFQPFFCDTQSFYINTK